MPTALLMQQSGPQAGPQGQSKTTTVTITGASRALSLPSSRFSPERRARQPRPRAGFPGARLSFRYPNPGAPARSRRDPGAARADAPSFLSVAFSDR